MTIEKSLGKIMDILRKKYGRSLYYKNIHTVNYEVGAG